MGTEAGPFRRTAVLGRDGVRLHVLDTGVPAGAGPVPCLLLLHGLGGCADEWRGIAAQLAGRARVVAFDARGHGVSTRRPQDLSGAAHVADAFAVVEEMGLGRVVLVGQSCGAHTALMTAAAHPEAVACLVLIEGGGVPALSVVGYNRRVDWPELLDRLSRVTGATPVVR